MGNYLFIAGEHPLDALPISVGDPQQHLGTDFASSLFVPGELPLAHAQLAGEVLLGDVEASDFAKAPPHGLPVNGGSLRWSTHEDSY